MRHNYFDLRGCDKDVCLTNRTPPTHPFRSSLHDVKELQASEGARCLRTRREPPPCSEAFRVPLGLGGRVLSPTPPPVKRLFHRKIHYMNQWLDCLTPSLSYPQRGSNVNRPGLAWEVKNPHKLYYFQYVTRKYLHNLVIIDPLNRDSPNGLIRRDNRLTGGIASRTFGGTAAIMSQRPN